VVVIAMAAPVAVAVVVVVLVIRIIISMIITTIAVLFFCSGQGYTTKLQKRKFL